ncbi:type VI secretion system membrane subunit TssM [bacterium]|nr:type VI secretion system membrane subunit TssM [bacterium]
MGIILTLLKQLKNPRALVVIVLSLLLATLFALGGRLGLGLVGRMIVGLVLVLISGGVIWLMGRMEKRKQAERIEQSLVLEAAGGPDDKSRKKASRDDMAAAIARLKGSRLADGRSGRDALSVLPWYLVVGAPGSGKSAAITSSGLPFPSEHGDAASACSEGRDCCWWFSNQAVVLEADGRFASDGGQAVDRDWDVFLELLSKQQRRPALNGVVVTVAADELAGLDEAQLKQRAAIVRRRVDRIAERLDLLCPVYLMITRCDRLNGFPEFFGDISGKARDQVWGATFSANLMTSPVPGDVFVQEFDLLARALERRRLPRLIRTEREQAVQQQAFLFPLEFYRLRDKLRTFGDTLFAPSQYTHQPHWRGFYFTSAGGEAAPATETVLTDVSQVIGLPGLGPVAPPPTAPVGDRRPLFLRTLFLNVLVPDQDLVRPTARAVRRRQSWRLVVRGIAAVLLPVLLTLSVISLVRNQGLAQRSEQLATDVRGLVPAGEQPRDITAALAELEPMREFLVKLDGWQDRRPITVDMGLYRGERLAAGLRGVYYDRLREVLLRPGRDRLERGLLGEYPGDRDEFNRFFARYQAYRMLVEPDQGDPDLVTGELQGAWHDPSATTETTARQLQLIDDHVHFAWRHPADLREACADLPRARENLVQRAEGYIRQFWASDLYYDTMVAEINRSGRPFSTAIEPAFSGVFTGADGADEDDLRVPFAFTRTGWSEYVLPRILGSEAELRDNWLLQEAFRDRTLDIRNELLARYLADHHDRWTTFLGSVDLVPPARLAETHSRLRGLAPRTSALFRFLERARDTMDLSGDTEGLPEDGREELARASADFKAWREFFRVQGEGEEAREPAAVYADLIDQLVEFLSELIAEGDAEANAAGAARQVFEKDGRGGTAVEDVSRQIRALVVEGGATSCDRALETFLRRPVALVWEACLLATERHLDARWREEIASYFSDKLNRYPLNPESGQDCSSSDFAQFFRPQGMLERFVAENLEVFLAPDRRPREVLDRRLGLTDAAVASLRKAAELRRVLFAQGVPVPEARFKLRPLQASYSRGRGPTITGTRLRVGEQSLFYDMGAPRTVEFVWSGDQYGQRASLTLQPDGLLPELRIEASDWALFRLLDFAEPVKLGETRYEYTFFLDDPGGRFRVKVPYELTTTSADNPFQRRFFDFDCPNSLFR